MIPSYTVIPASHNETILSFCQEIYHLLGRNFKSDCYKWLLFDKLRNAGFVYQLCGNKLPAELFAELIKVELPDGVTIGLVIKAEKGVYAIKKTDMLCSSHSLQPHHNFIVNFGRRKLEYRIF